MQKFDRILRLLEDLPAAAAGKFTLVAGEDVRIRVCSDLTDNRIYGGQWGLVTPERVVLAPEAGVDGVVALHAADGHFEPPPER